MTDTAVDPSQIRAEIDGAAKTAAAMARGAASKAADKAVEVRKVVEEGATVAREWAGDQTDVLRDTVQTRPFVSVGVSAGTAFAAGLVLGILLMRR